MRINQFVAATTDLSRRAADAAVAAGRVQINGRAAELGDAVPPDTIVALDGQLLHLPAAQSYLMLNKPTGYITSRARQGASRTIYDLLRPPDLKLRPAGRLDRDSSGLVLLSDDGAFIHRYTHPSFGKSKVYEITLNRSLSRDALQQLQRGVRLTDGPSRVTLQQVRGPHLTLSLTEGRNRQLRRTFDALGYNVERLHRTQIGPYRLGRLQPGAWQEVTPQ